MCLSPALLQDEKKISGEIGNIDGTETLITDAIYWHLRTICQCVIDIEYQPMGTFLRSQLLHQVHLNFCIMFEDNYHQDQS